MVDKRKQKTFISFDQIESLNQYEGHVFEKIMIHTVNARVLVDLGYKSIPQKGGTAQWRKKDLSKLKIFIWCIS